jgi:hypothetical protein
MRILLIPLSVLLMLVPSVRFCSSLYPIFFITFIVIILLVPFHFLFFISLFPSHLYLSSSPKQNVISGIFSSSTHRVYTLKIANLSFYLSPDPNFIFPHLVLFVPVPLSFCHVPFTYKKEKEIFLLYKEIQKGSVAKSYIRKGFLIYEEMRKYLTKYEEAVSHL